jgi:hypothetical protein
MLRGHECNQLVVREFACTFHLLLRVIGGDSHFFDQNDPYNELYYFNLKND